MTDLTSTARRRELGAELRRIRELSGYNGLDMANRLSWTTTMLSRVETGKRTVSPLEVASYTGLCGVAGDELAELLGLADEPDNYRLKPHGLLPDALRTLIFHESTANEIDTVEPVYMPGVMQTEDYARAVFWEAGILDPADIEDAVRIRMSRHDVLTRWNPAQCAFYVHENVLRASVGGPQGDV
jgi:transcriptional regulator with XRE-family HTH domain